MTADLFLRKDALLSPCGTYRYWLTRTWDASLPAACWVMLNPSIADAVQDDPTIRRCLAFARRWGCGELTVVNLFALRAADPGELLRAADPVGPENNLWLVRAARSATRVIAAWGVAGRLHNRDQEVLRMLRGFDVPVECLGRTKDDFSRHPLYVKGDVEPVLLEG